MNQIVAFEEYMSIKKYKIINDDESKYNRIVALRDFSDVKQGDYGGFVESTDNLSQLGNCWIYDNALAVENSLVCGNAKIKNSAVIRGNAIVRDNAVIKDCAYVGDNANINDNVCVYEKARISENATLEGNAQVFGSAEIKGCCVLYGNAKVYGYAQLKYHKLNIDMFKNMKKLIACSLNVYPINNKYYLYKIVNKTKFKNIFVSTYDKNFIYELNKESSISKEDIKLINKQDKLESCSVGIHASEPTYWTLFGNTLLQLEIDVKDIITCMAGKIRAKKAQVIKKIY